MNSKLLIPNSLSQTLIGATKAAAPPSSSPLSSLLLSPTHRHYSTRSSPSNSQSPDLSDAEALAAVRIEDAIHRIIVKRSAPHWLPFLPGASYWVPPKRRHYAIALAFLLHKLSNSLSDDQVMSLATSRGWPSSAFYLQPPPQDASSDRREAVEISNCASVSEDEEG